MDYKLRRGMIAAAAVAALAGGGAAIAGATGGGGDEAGPDDGNGQPVTGSPLDRASAIAIDEVGGGEVTGSEIRDEEGYYEIEVTKPDGSQFDVHLDQSFKVIDSSSDGGGES